MSRWSPQVQSVAPDFGSAVANALNAYLAVGDRKYQRTRQAKLDAEHEQDRQYAMSQRPLEDAVRSAQARDLGIVSPQTEPTGDPSQSLQARYGTLSNYGRTLSDALLPQSPPAHAGHTAWDEDPRDLNPSGPAPRLGAFNPVTGAFNTASVFAMPGAGQQAAGASPMPNLEQQYGTRHVHAPGVTHVNDQHDLDPSQSREGRATLAATAQRQREGEALAALLKSRGIALPDGMTPDVLGSVPSAVQGDLLKPTPFNKDLAISQRIADIRAKNPKMPLAEASKQARLEFGEQNQPSIDEQVGKAVAIGTALAGLRQGRQATQQELHLAQMYQNHPQVKNATEIASRLTQMEAAKPDAAGDLDMIFGYMKILDPTSVVREGEQASAANARGVPATIQQMYNKVLTGEKLAPEQRRQFLSQAQAIAQQHRQLLQPIMQRYGAQAQKMGADPSFVVADPYQALDLNASPAAASSTHAPSREQQLWDAAVAKHGRDKVLKEYGPRPE